MGASEPKVCPSNPRIVLQLSRSAGQNDSAVLENVPAVRDIEGDQHVLLDQHESGAGLVSRLRVMAGAAWDELTIRPRKYF